MRSSSWADCLARCGHLPSACVCMIAALTNLSCHEPARAAVTDSEEGSSSDIQRERRVAGCWVRSALRVCVSACVCI